MLKMFMVKAQRFFQQSLVYILKGYQYFIIPLLGPRCRFHPSCSEYAIDAIKHHTISKGCYLIVRRLLKCHPFHPGGYDPLNASRDVINNPSHLPKY